jgi:hypothetical protein
MARVSVLRDTCLCSHDGNCRGRSALADPGARVDCGSEDDDSRPVSGPEKCRAEPQRLRRQILDGQRLLGVVARNTEEVEGERSR